VVAPLLVQPKQVQMLSPADLELLAFWATKTAVTCQYVLPTHRRMASRRFRNALYVEKRVPIGTVVRIGRHDVPWFQVLVHSQPVPLAHVDRPLEIRAHGARPSMNFTTTIVIGSLLIHVLVYEGADIRSQDVAPQPIRKQRASGRR